MKYARISLSVMVLLGLTQSKQLSQQTAAQSGSGQAASGSVQAAGGSQSLAGAASIASLFGFGSGGLLDQIDEGLSDLNISPVSTVVEPAASASRRRALQQNIVDDSATLNLDIQDFAETFFADPMGTLMSLSTAVANTSADFFTQIQPVLGQQATDTFSLFSTFASSIQQAIASSFTNGFQGNAAQFQAALTAAGDEFQTAFQDLSTEAQQQFQGIQAGVEGFVSDPAGSINQSIQLFTDIETELATQGSATFDGLIQAIDQLVKGLKDDPTATLESVEQAIVGLIQQTEQTIVATIQNASSQPDGGFLTDLETFISTFNALEQDPVGFIQGAAGGAAGGAATGGATVAPAGTAARRAMVSDLSASRRRAMVSELPGDRRRAMVSELPADSAASRRRAMVSDLPADSAASRRRAMVSELPTGSAPAS